MAMYYLIPTDLREVPFLQKEKNMQQANFSHPVEVTGSMYFGNLKKIGIYQFA